MSEYPHIFISSTWQDLQPEREAVEEALKRLQDTSYVSMKYFGSRPETPEAVSLAEVERSNIYIGIFAHRYGSGITEAEYRRARNQNLPCLIYIKDDTIPILPAYIEHDPDKIAKLKTLKQEIKANHTVSYFKSPDQLATQVVADVHNLLGKTPNSKEAHSKQGSKFQVTIDHSQGLVIGDDSKVFQYFSDASRSEGNQQSELRANIHEVDILLVTVSEVEASTVLNRFNEQFGRTFERFFKWNKTYYNLGEIGGARTLMVQSEQGTGGPSGSLLTIHESIYALHPNAVVMVGIAFGVDPEKQNIGDILVSQRLQMYEHQKISTGLSGESVIQPRGDRIQASPRLLDRFRSGLKDWPEPVHVEFGLVLSGEKLIDNIAFRGQLCKVEPNAIGGEMEGAGLYAAAYLEKVDWIVVKAICDWADGNKDLNKDQYQKMAADNATRFTFHVIRQGGFNQARRSV